MTLRPLYEPDLEKKYGHVLPYTKFDRKVSVGGGRDRIAVLSHYLQNGPRLLVEDPFAVLDGIRYNDLKALRLHVLLKKADDRKIRRDDLMGTLLFITGEEDYIQNSALLEWLYRTET